jgi:hypothetical protein
MEEGHTWICEVGSTAVLMVVVVVMGIRKKASEKDEERRECEVGLVCGRCGEEKEE